ncbi:Similar to S.cerevisiae protein YKE2 (Subunit of the heterohexameric Gim/prefoldin protein complex) [Malassezia sympodialis ATCC 42132]|uniref:Similar to S.cerevisiae protein YKE2 (Subunit of the heterohexameric Gim/prefoldin protein complex) n=1 Tax=Malassezia sympodialis (strain ATCC 42132) TaxID=1230383 RepID=A0A1M8A255_MALS4|nr:Similar to S.cerevisiae protein YKE2 (Subunit of the heterohexameric Gim/prefoldin protein complex) [Malassezia sympodialis ATCC 42132]
MATETTRAMLTKLQEVQTAFELVVDSHQQLLSQLSENQQVQKEFSSLPGDARIYKRTGPVLVPQEFSEAKVNVDKRIDFIQSEIDRVDVRLKDLASKRDGIQSEIMALQREP